MKLSVDVFLFGWTKFWFCTAWYGVSFSLFWMFISFLPIIQLPFVDKLSFSNCNTLASKEFSASHSVTEWSIAWKLAPAQVHCRGLFIQTKLQRLKVCAYMRGVTEGLLGWQAAGTPEIVFWTEHHVRNLVGADLRLYRERLLAILTLQTSLEVVPFEQLNRNSFVSEKVWVQKFLQVGVSLTFSLLLGLIDGVEVTFFSCSLHLSDFFL